MRGDGRPRDEGTSCTEAGRERASRDGGEGGEARGCLAVNNSADSLTEAGAVAVSGSGCPALPRLVSSRCRSNTQPYGL